MADMAQIMDGLGSLFSYPGEDYRDRTARCQHDLMAAYPEAGVLLQTFVEALGENRADWEDTYTRTFDLNPVCAPEIGWHLFGEDYARGRFMARLRGMNQALDIPESGELPDHLSTVLRLLGQMPHADASDFVEMCVAPALDKMLGALVEKENPYEYALRAVHCVLVAHFQTCLLEITHE